MFGDRGPVLAQLQLPTERCTNCLRSWCDGSPTPSVTIQPTLLHSHEKHHGREQQILELKEKFHVSLIPQPTISVNGYDRHNRIQCSQQYQLKFLSPAIQVVFDFANAFTFKSQLFYSRNASASGSCWRRLSPSIRLKFSTQKVSVRVSWWF